jgi:hypothetical protein
MGRFFFLLLLCTLTYSSCRDDIGESLFEMNYPPREFVLPAGLNTTVAYVQSINNIPTSYPDFVNASGHSADEVTKIVPRFARLISLDGLDLGFLSSISVRICPITQQDCSFADEVFYIDDLYRRDLSTVNLNPGLGNVKDLLSGGLYKLEIVMFPGEITPYTVDCRLEYSFEAFK